MIRRIGFSSLRTLPTVLGIACFLLFAAQARADLITNGSFELGTFVNDGNQTMILPLGSTTITGWTVVADQIAWINAGNPWGLSAQDGNKFLDFTAYPTGAPFGGVSQNITTIAGHQYVLSFYFGSYTARWGGPPMSILASAGPASQTFTVSTAQHRFHLYAVLPGVHGECIDDHNQPEGYGWSSIHRAGQRQRRGSREYCS